MSYDFRSILVAHKINDSRFPFLFRSKAFKDYVYLPSKKDLSEDVKKGIKAATLPAATDFSISANSFKISSSTDTHHYLLRTPSASKNVFCIKHGHIDTVSCHSTYLGVKPMFDVTLTPSTDEQQTILSSVISTLSTKDTTSAPTVKIGEYPKTAVDIDTAKALEYMYQNYKPGDNFRPTGRVYTSNSHDSFWEAFNTKLNPEFEFGGKKYVRVSVKRNGPSITSDAKIMQGIDEQIGFDSKSACHSVYWLKVEPISCVIKNWDNLPKSINPAGNGTAEKMVLETEDIVISGIPFFNSPTIFQKNYRMSTIRNYLNGLDDAEESNPYTKFSHLGGFLNEALNPTREPIREYIVPHCEVDLPQYALDGCIFLDKIVVHNQMQHISNNAIPLKFFKYCRLNPETQELIFTKTPPKNRLEYSQTVFIEELVSKSNFRLSSLINSSDYAFYQLLSSKLRSVNFYIPQNYINWILGSKNFEFVSNLNFSFFENEVYQPYKKSLDNSTNYMAVLRFASYIGCFNNPKDKQQLNQKASSFLYRLLSNSSDPSSLYRLFKKLPLSTIPNENLLKFLSVVEKNGVYSNVNMLLKLENEYPGLFCKVIQNFDRLANYRTTLNEKGQPVSVPWEQALVNFYLSASYKNITEENQDIANLFITQRLGQEVFEEAARLRRDAILKNVPHHILGKPLNERTLLDEIADIQRETEKVLVESGNLLAQNTERLFTYEWLDKYDPKNFIIGIYTNCCCTITSVHYGSTIAENSILLPTVQNLVVRDHKGNIAAKGTMFINKEAGYVVFNDFELDSKYKKHELETGVYDVPPTSKDEQIREQIFNAFMRGIRQFVREYDAMNPDTPIQKVVVGEGYNRLKRQCRRYESLSPLIDIPTWLAFEDASIDQRLLYSRDDEPLSNENYSSPNTDDHTNSSETSTTDDTAETKTDPTQLTLDDFLSEEAAIGLTFYEEDQDTNI